MDTRYAPEHEATLRYDDPQIGVRWPAPPSVLSARDKAGDSLDSLLPRLMAAFPGSPRTVA